MVWVCTEGGGTILADFHIFSCGKLVSNGRSRKGCRAVRVGGVLFNYSDADIAQIAVQQSARLLSDFSGQAEGDRIAYDAAPGDYNVAVLVAFGSRSGDGSGSVVAAQQSVVGKKDRLAAASWEQKGLSLVGNKALEVSPHLLCSEES